MPQIEIRHHTIPERLAYLAGKLREGDVSAEAVALALEVLADEITEAAAGSVTTELQGNLAGLDAAGALGGIRAIVAERLRQVREGFVPPEERATLGAMALIAGRDDVMPAAERYANAGALLAAIIDKTEGGQ
jgi:hypothetical protein